MRILARTEFTGLNTGYAIYMRAVLGELHRRGHTIAELASGVNPTFPGIQYVPWKVYPNMPDPNNENAKQAFASIPGSEFGSWQFEQVLLDFKPDVVTDVSDVWHYEYQLRSPLRDYFAHVAMVPVDAFPQNRHWLDIYNKSDGILGYTQWGLDLIKDGGCTKTMGVPMPFADPTYVPVADKKSLQSQLGLGDIKIIGMVGRNQKRKLFLNLFESFANFLKESGRDDVYLYVHSSFPDRGYEFDRETIKYGISHRVLYSYVCQTSECRQFEASLFKGCLTTCAACGQRSQVIANVQAGLSPQQMAFAYNLMDLYVQVSTNEGFCLPVMEAAACGVPCIATDYSSLSEVIRLVGGKPITPSDYTTELETGRQFAVANDEELTQEMLNFFSLPSSLIKVKGVSARRAYLKNWDIAKIVDIWDNAINSVKAKRKWADPVRTFQPIAPPQNLSTSQYARWLIVNILGMPELAGSFMETRLIRDLNDGFSPGGFGGEFFHEINSAVLSGSYQKFDREIALGHLVSMVDKRNFWEERRVGTL